MTEARVQPPLIISQSPKRQLSSLGIIAAFLCSYIVLGILDVIDGWLMWSGVVIFGVISLIGLHGILRARGASWELRLDQDGVTVHGNSTTPWSDLAEVRSKRMGPQWFFLSRGPQVVAFVGRPGVTMPNLPSVRAGTLAKRATQLRERRYGTQLLLIPQAFDASTETIMEAVERFSNVPVVRG